MILHEAIKRILIEEKGGLSSSQIADKINKSGLYKRKDNQPVPSSQILARVNNYKNLFTKEGKLICLKKYDEFDKLDEIIKINLFEFTDKLRNQYSFNNLELLELIMVSLSEFEKLGNREGVGRKYYESVRKRCSNTKSWELNHPDLIESYIKLVTKLSNYSNRYRILKKLINWTSDSFRDNSSAILPDYISNIIGHLNIYSNKTILMSSLNSLSSFMLDILEQNQDKEFIYAYNSLWKNENMMRLNSLLMELVSNISIDKKKSYSTKKIPCIGVFNPPWGINNVSSVWPSEYAFLWDELNEDKEIKMDRAVVVIPEGALFSRGEHLKARKELSKFGALEAIISMPFNSKYMGISSVTLAIFNFENAIGNVLFADFTKIKDFNIETDWKNIVEIYNNKVENEGLSKIITLDEIIEKDYLWTPHTYLSKKFKLEIKSGYKNYKLRDIINGYKRGQNIDRKSLYENGEIKYIRTKDLNKSKLFLDITDDILGVDQDQLPDKARLFNDGIIISLIGNDLKPNIINVNTNLIIDSNLAILKASEKIVIKDFLVRELASDYIIRQIATHRRGVTIPYLRISDLLNIEIQLPSIKEQKEILYKESKNLTEENEYYHQLQIEQGKLYKYIGTIKHTLKQPLATITEDVKTLKRYLEQKENKGIIDLNELTVDLFPGENAEEWEENSVSKTLKRVTSAINQAHRRLEQSEKLLETSKIKLQSSIVVMREFLKNKMKEFSDIYFEIKGGKHEVKIDKQLWEILIENLIDNAKKHGFKEIKNPKVFFNVSLIKVEDGSKQVVIEYKNNGKPFDENFDLNKYNTSDDLEIKSIGDGFGLFLINNIIKRHNGYFEIDNKVAKSLNEYNVVIRFYLPEV